MICNLIENHTGELRKILREAKDVNIRAPMQSNLRKLPIYSIGHSYEGTDYTIETAEDKYTEDYPEWKTESKAVPPYDLYHDKLIKKRTPYIRATDLEETFKKLKSSVPSIDIQDFNKFLDVIQSSQLI